jgi:hypothetical protein
VTHPSLGARSAAAGARIGLRAAVFFSVLALAGWLVAGESAFERRLGIGPGALILVYLFGGVPGGVVFALLRPRVRDAWSAALAGAATLLPVAAAVAAAQLGRSAWSARGALATLAASFALGSAWGAMFWRSRRRDAARSGDAPVDSTSPAS